MCSVRGNSFSEGLLQCAALYLAIQNGHDDVVEYISQLNIPHVDEEMEKFTTIFLAAQNGQIDTLKLFFGEIKKEDIFKNKMLPGNTDINIKPIEKNKPKNCININTTNNNGRTTLSFVAELGLCDIVKTLMYMGADVNITDISGYSPMHYAATKGHANVVRLLSDKVKNINLIDNTKATALFWATEHGHDEVVKILLAKGADVNIGSNGYLPIISATFRERETIAVMLLNKDVNKETIIKSISIAIETRKTGILALLLNKVGVDVTDNQKKTPLVLAVERGHEDIVRFLLSEGANVNYFDSNGFSLLHHAALVGHTGIVELLLEKGLYINASTHVNGFSPLILASINCHEDVVKLLLEKGADRNATDNAGNSAKIFAKLQGYKQIYKLLKSKNLK